MRLRNVLTFSLLAVFGSMTLFGAVTYASDGLNPFHQQPIDAPPQVHQPSAIKADEPKSIPVPNMDPTPADLPRKANEPTETKADSASKPEVEHPKAEQPISEPVVDPKPVDEPVKPKKSDQDQADEKPKKSEQAQREKDSESGEKEELVKVSLTEDQPVSKQEISKSNQANSEPKGEVAAEPVVADNSQEQVSASQSASDQEEEADEQEPKTANGGKMEQTGSETVSLLLISIGVLGMGATLTVRYGWKGA